MNAENAKPHRWLLNPKLATILFATLTLYSVFYVAMWIIIPVWGPSWVYWVSFFGRKIAPILLIVGFSAVSMFGEKGKIGRLLNKYSYGIILFVAILLVLLSIGYANGTQFETYTNGGNWNYIPCFEYGAFLIGGFYLIGKKQGYNFYTFMLLCLALFATGFLYELPVIFKAEHYQPIHVMHPFFISSNIIALAVFAILLYLNKARIGKLQIATFAFFMGYSILIFIFALNPSTYAFTFPLNYPFHSLTWYIIDGWLPRLPTLLFMTSLVYGVKT